MHTTPRPLPSCANPLVLNSHTITYSKWSVSFPSMYPPTMQSHPGNPMESCRTADRPDSWPITFETSVPNLHNTPAHRLSSSSPCETATLVFSMTRMPDDCCERILQLATHSAQACTGSHRPVGPGRST
ncbi:hypothetical protein BCR44DRAFT_343282 [Catenaria anguillulae PL171]|uniref:Uncharacterized protein n=1 Tax=Catenaria anguillulae PL171 TaxID=765915 RepID=A0A1Y2HLQ4_9FUNG|nr:hypothetical protein BCR44DRAFT_343282 [Catenaria anguillulae PL171]